VLSIFVNAIKARTELPVYYSQDLGNKVRHIYLPTEKIREEISDRDWSYQDTPLKSKHDLNIYVLTHNKEEIEREIRGFKMNFALFLARKMEQIYSGDIQVSDPEVRKTVNNVRINTSFTPFCEAIVNQIIAVFKAPTSKGFTSSRAYYRKYLMELIARRKSLQTNCAHSITAVIQQSTSRTVDVNAFSTYIFSLLVEFSKNEITNLIN
jgi:hypothetical protein